MTFKKKPRAPKEYAKQLYMADRCNGHTAPYSDYTIIDTRIRAFLDGVNWERRRRSAVGKTAEHK
jgi:hypothetical protein